MTPQQLKAMKQALEALEDRSSLMKWQKARDAINEALAEHAMRETQRLGQEIEQEPVAHCEAGPNYCWKCLEESNPTYGSEEIKKLREVNKSLMKNIEELKKEPPPFWPVVQHLLDEYGLQFIDIVAAYRESTQPEQEPVAYDKTEMNFFVQDLYDKKMQEGKHGHYETMFHVVHQAIKRATPPQRTEQNFCPRCGKRTKDIHTCTPPQENT